MRSSVLKLPFAMAAAALIHSPGRAEQADHRSGAALPGHVPAANAKVTSQAAPNVLSPELRATPVAQGSTPLENAAPSFPF